MSCVHVLLRIWNQNSNTVIYEKRYLIFLIELFFYMKGFEFLVRDVDLASIDMIFAHFGPERALTIHDFVRLHSFAFICSYLNMAY